MPYFSNKTDEPDYSVTPESFDPKTHYEGYLYPSFDTDSMVDISSTFYSDNRLYDLIIQEGLSFLQFYMDLDGNINSPLSRRDFYTQRLKKMRPGKFMQKFFPGVFTGEDLTNFVAKLKIPELKIGTDFRDVYERSGRHASSCMAGKFGEWRFSPLDAYNGGDLQIAYTENSEGEVTNRALIWPEKKVFDGVYGSNPIHIKSLLQNMGYKVGELKGARLKLLNKNPLQKNYIVLPYIDSCGGASMGPDGQLRIGHQEGEVQWWGSTQEGYVRYEQLYDEINNKYGYPHEMQQCKHPYSGDRVYVLKTMNPVIDPWGFLCMRKTHPNYYMENVYPRYFYRHSFECPVFKMRFLNTQAAYILHEGVERHVSYAAIAKLYRRDIIDGQLYPINEMKELINGEFIRWVEDSAIQAAA